MKDLDAIGCASLALEIYKEFHPLTLEQNVPDAHVGEKFSSASMLQPSTIHPGTLDRDSMARKKNLLDDSTVDVSSHASTSIAETRECESTALCFAHLQKLNLDAMPAFLMKRLTPV